MGPLTGIRIIEIAAIGPAPFAAMLLADLGADIIRIDRTKAGAMGAFTETRFDITSRGRRSIALDLKDPRGVEAALKLIDSADALMEGFRPGVTEKLGIGPDTCLARNPKLVYGRMTGWGQDGPLASAAGHDLNYIALTGALAAIGARDGVPIPPLNLVGDYGGGALYLVVGMLAALLEAKASGKGQVVDAAMVDGASSLLAAFYGMNALGFWNEQRASNMLDGGAPFYRVYETSDGKHVALGAIEPQFWAEFVARAGLPAEDLASQHDQSTWESMHGRLTELFQSKTRQEWCDLLEGSDACFAPVLTMSEAPSHPHIEARGSLVEINGVVQPGAAPRFSRTPSAPGAEPPVIGAQSRSVLQACGYGDAEIDQLAADGVVLLSEA
jgi:alpha-methylacyl-CoA racemase